MNKTIVTEYIKELIKEELPKPKKVVYSGIFLDEENHQKLLQWWEQEVGKPLLDKLFAHHMTLKFKPTPEEVANLPLGKTVMLKIVGWAADERAQAVLMQTDVPSNNANPHITISTDSTTSPAYSNELITNGSNSVAGPTIVGVVDTFPRL